MAASHASPPFTAQPRGAASSLTLPFRDDSDLPHRSGSSTRARSTNDGSTSRGRGPRQQRGGPPHPRVTVRPEAELQRRHPRLAVVCEREPVRAFESEPRVPHTSTWAAPIRRLRRFRQGSGEARVGCELRPRPVRASRPEQLPHRAGHTHAVGQIDLERTARLNSLRVRLCRSAHRWRRRCPRPRRGGYSNPLYCYSTTYQRRRETRPKGEANHCHRVSIKVSPTAPSHIGPRTRLLSRLFVYLASFFINPCPA